MAPITTPSTASRSPEDAELFERLVLEINQAGLSWLTILKKREAFRQAYGGFDPEIGRPLRRAGREAAAGRRGHHPQPAQGRGRDRQRADHPRASARVHGASTPGSLAHHPRPRPEWVKLFKQTFRFTGGEIVGEFLMSTGWLPGAHRESCPVYREGAEGEADVGR